MTSRYKNFLALRTELLNSDKLFVDPDFPPDYSSLSLSGGPSSLGFDKVIWKRPKEISKNPKFFVKGATRFDFDQGALGNCWFIAGAAVVATCPKLLPRVVPPDQEFDDHYAGVFFFNFWWFGTWTEIIIDDYLPTDGAKLLFGQNREEPDEFWPALLEKAYAKLRGCYEALHGGFISDCLVDMTGCISERVDLRNKSSFPPNLYNIVVKCFKLNSLMCAGIYQKSPSAVRETEIPNGLYSGHAYSITGFAEVPFDGSNVQLIRVRNPWGRGEWTGDWSDRSSQIKSLSPEEKQRLGIVVRLDGEFWMPFKDFVENFDELAFIHLEPDNLTSEIANDERKQSWEIAIYHDAWIKGFSAGGCGNPPYTELFWKNPQFFVTLKDVDVTDDRNMCTLIVSLIEKEEGERKKYATSFALYKLKDPQMRPLDGESASRNALVLERRADVYEYHREKTKRYELSPGTYVVIPTTFEPNQEAEFMLRIITEKQFDSGVLDEETAPVEPVIPAVEDPVKITFQKYAGEHAKLYAHELKHFLATMSSIELKEQLWFSTESCRSLITMLDKNESGALNLTETESGWKKVKLFVMVFKQFDKDMSGYVDTYELSNMFVKLGFRVGRNVISTMVRRYGGKDRKISLADFIIMLCKFMLMLVVYESKSRGGKNSSFGMDEFLSIVMWC